MSAQNLITEHLDLWTGAIASKSSSGRGSSSKIELTGVNKLRELILELAMRGKLTQQNSDDEPAKFLLDRIRARKTILASSGEIKKQREIPSMREMTPPFSLPAGWEWAQLEELGHDWGQKVPNKDFSYIDVGSIDNLRGKIKEPSILSPNDAPSRARKIVKYGTLIYSTIRPYLQNIAVVEDHITPEPIASTAFAVIHPLEDMPARFLLHYLRSPSFIRYVESIQTGIAYPAINDKQFFSGMAPVPPLSEQHRIVQKVDELMALCDRLEQQTSDQLEAHETLVDTLLGTLTQSENATDLADNWALLATHFDTLFTTEQSIDKLKKAILQLAVMGRLTGQDPSEESAKALLEKVAIGMNHIAEGSRTRKGKELPPISAEELPFKKPLGWEAVRLQALIQISSGDGLTSAEMNAEGGIPVFGGNGVCGFHDKANVSEKTLVIGRVGYYCGSVHITPDKAWVTDNAFVVRYAKEHLNQRYLYWLLRATDLKEQDNATAQPVISGRKLYPIVVIIAPRQEQDRIVGKIDELMTICDQLKTHLNQASETRCQLADAIVEGALH